MGERDEQHAAGAGIEWAEWSDDAFARAQREDKLVLFDSGATWCHWCHVMDHVTYDDPEVIERVNAGFVAVRIDRDRRPDVDGRMQRAAALIRPFGPAGGWPLTALLTPEGQVLFKATFVPPRASSEFGTPVGLLEILDRVEAYWREHRDEVRHASETLERQFAEQDQRLFHSPGTLGPQRIDDVWQGLQESYDDKHGGFGMAPKFFTAPAMDLVLLKAWEGSERARHMLTQTLNAIARGGVYDHVGGGFHRYSVDERWHVPHFEKMAYDNAALLALYANAFALTGEDRYARVVAETLQWIARDLGGSEGAQGFCASQDADTYPGDDGDYFTWTLDELRNALPPDLADLAVRYYDVTAKGDMRERPGRNVLHVPAGETELAIGLGVDLPELRRRVEEIRARLLAARHDRTAPSVDATVFADLNGMLIDAHLTAWERCGEEAAGRTAIGVLDALLRTHRDDRGLFAHYVEDGRPRGVGHLDDQAWMGRALLHAFRLTVEPRYLDAAEALGRYLLNALAAPEGGFYSTPPAEASGAPTAVPPARTWEDSPIRSGQSVAVEFLLDLAYLTRRVAYGEAAVAALASFAGGELRSWGTFVAGYAQALDRHLNGPRSIVVVGASDDDRTAALALAARRTPLPGGMALVLDAEVEWHRALLERLGYAGRERPVAYACHGTRCLPPAEASGELTQRVETMRKHAA